MPVTSPVVLPIVSHDGAPGASVNEGAGTPVAANVYEYGEPPVAVSGGAAAVNAGGCETGDTTAVVCAAPESPPSRTVRRTE